MTPDILPAETTSDEKLMAALAYWGNILWFVPALIIYLLKKDESVFVKKHALQCLLLHVAVAVLYISVMVVFHVMASMPIIGWVFALFGMMMYSVMFLGFFIYSAYLGYKVFMGEDVTIPRITPMVEQYMQS